MTVGDEDCPLEVGSTGDNAIICYPPKDPTGNMDDGYQVVVSPCTHGFTGKQKQPNDTSRLLQIRFLCTQVKVGYYTVTAGYLK